MKLSLMKCSNKLRFRQVTNETHQSQLSPIYFSCWSAPNKIIAQVDVNVQVAKSGQFVVDLGAKEKHLKHVLELQVLGLRSPFL